MKSNLAVQTPMTSRAGELATSLISCIGEDDFAASALERMYATLPIGAWTVYRLKEGDLPEFSLGATRGHTDITGKCWEQYRAGLYLADRSFEKARPRAEGSVALSKLEPTDLTPAHRASIYDQYDIRQRLSLLIVEGQGSLLAVNLYRFAGQRPFSKEDERDLMSAAPVLVASVRRHIELVRPAAGRQSLQPRGNLEMLVLRERCPKLTERELEVCMGLVQGMSFDGVARQLNLSAATVKTYRDRAFRRLGIHHRNQLYGMCVAGVLQARTYRTLDA